MGEKVCACVVAARRPNAGTLPAIVQYLRDEKRVAAYKLPEYLLSMPTLAAQPGGQDSQNANCAPKPRPCSHQPKRRGMKPVVLLIPGMLNTPPSGTASRRCCRMRAEIRIADVLTQSSIADMARDAWALWPMFRQRRPW
jgi:hypothetical protein